MRSKNVFWGVILVTIGILFVLRNTGVIYFNWWSVFNLWPVFLIVLGISLLPIKGIVRIILAFLVIAGSLWFIGQSDFYQRYHYWTPHNWFWWDHRDDYSYNDRDYDYDEDYEWRDQLLFENYSDEMENAVLNLEAIAGKFTVAETTDYLLEFRREGNFGKYYLQADNEGSAVVLDINMDAYIKNSPKLKNEATISLHPDPVWSMVVDAGAAKIDFDLSPFKIDRIDLDSGASSVKIRLGNRYPDTDLSFNTGAADLVIEVPRSAGCRIDANTVLSSKNLEGFNKLENGDYQTENFDDASSKIKISIDAALSSLKVVRY